MEQPLIEDGLKFEVEDNNDLKQVSKDLFTEGNINLKTELSDREIATITKIQFMQEMYGLHTLENAVMQFKQLRVSKDRKSRGEFINAVGGEAKTKEKEKLWSGFFGGGKQ
jgi:hypothetical protein